MTFAKRYLSYYNSYWGKKDIPLGMHVFKMSAADNIHVSHSPPRRVGHQPPSLWDDIVTGITIMKRNTIISLAICALLINGSTYSLAYGQQSEEVSDNTIQVTSDVQSHVYTDAMGWRFEATISKAPIYPYGAIPIELKITNISDRPQICADMDYTRRFSKMQLLDEFGNNIPLIGIRVTATVGIASHEINPGESRSKTRNLAHFLGADRAFYDEGDRPKLLPGCYELVISQCVDPGNGTPSDDKTITLPPLEFCIEEPTGSIAEAYSLFREGYLLLYKDKERAMAMLEKVMVEYSETPYDIITNEIIIHKLSLETFHDPDLHLAYLKRLLQKHPESPENLGNVYELTKLMSREELSELCRPLLTNPKATRVVQHIQEQYPWVFIGEDK